MAAIAAKPAKAAVSSTKAPAPAPAPAAKLPVAAGDSGFMDEVRLGFEELRKLNHDELRGVIAKRVQLLEGVLKGREERRAAIETAKMAGKLLDIRRERAVRIHRTVNAGSYWAAAATTFLLFVVMI